MAISTLSRKHAVVLAVALVVAIAYGKAALASVALGGGIQIVNRRALERGVASMLGLAEGGQSLLAQLLIHLRWMWVLGLAAIVLFTIPVEPVWFVVGLSTLVPAVLWHGLRETPPAVEL